MLKDRRFGTVTSKNWHGMVATTNREFGTARARTLASGSEDATDGFSRIHSLQDTPCARRTDREALRSRDTFALQETVKNAPSSPQNIAQESQEELQGNAQTVVDIGNEKQDCQDEIKRLDK